MIVSHSKKLVYLAPPKTGSVSVMKLLKGEPFNGVVIGNEHEAHHGVEWSEDLAGYFHFITIRHPYPRMFSLWRMICNGRTLHKKNSRKWPRFKGWAEQFPDREPTLEELIQHPDSQLTMRNQWRCSWHLEQLGRPVGGMIVRMENFYKDLRHVKYVGQHIDQIGHENKRIDSGPGWRETFTPHHVEIIQDVWAEDFDRFGYNRKLENVPQGG